MKNRINKLPKDYISLGPPYITKDEEQAVVNVLHSGTLSLGPYQKQFEKIFAKFVGTRYAVAVSSGTSGLHAALVASGIKAGDEVITSPFSFIASANAILYVGAKPVFVDIDPKTLNIDPKKFVPAITKKTTAILPIHIFGYPVDYDKILKIAKKHHLKIVEDACESLGAEYKRRKVGNFGNLSVFAFYANKQITTGEGGMIVANNKKEYDMLKSVVNQGRSDAGQWLSHDKLGFNYRMDEMSAAMGWAQMTKIKEILRSRKLSAQIYNSTLKNLKGVRTLADTEGHYSRSWQVYVVILDESIDRNSVMALLSKKGIQSKPYLPSIHLQDYYRKIFGYKEGDYPISEKVSKSSLALPLYTGMRRTEVERVCKELEAVLKLLKK